MSLSSRFNYIQRFDRERLLQPLKIAGHEIDIEMIFRSSQRGVRGKAPHGSFCHDLCPSLPREKTVCTPPFCPWPFLGIPARIRFSPSNIYNIIHACKCRGRCVLFCRWTLPTRIYLKFEKKSIETSTGPAVNRFSQVAIVFIVPEWNVFHCDHSVHMNLQPVEILFFFLISFNSAFKSRFFEIPSLQIE